MNDRRRAEHTAGPGSVACAAATAVLLAALPWSASGRLPDPVATRWTLTLGAPNGSVPLWAAAVLPALCWVLLAAAVFLVLRRGGDVARTALGPWAAALLLSTGVLLVGAQSSVVRANLDRADWRLAQLPAPWLVATLAGALTAGVLGRLLGARRWQAAPAAGNALEGPVLRVPEGQRLVWVSRTVNPWLRAVAGVSALVAAAAAVALVGDLAAPAPLWALLVSCALVAVGVAGCAAVRARVTERGLEVAYGLFGWPVRRWAAADVESARTEHRTPAQVGGWGYRLSGLGTTVMLRGGECLVVRTRGRGREFAVSVDDASRGAALLNALNTAR